MSYASYLLSRLQELSTITSSVTVSLTVLRYKHSHRLQVDFTVHWKVQYSLYNRTWWVQKFKKSPNKQIAFCRERYNMYEGCSYGNRIIFEWFATWSEITSQEFLPIETRGLLHYLSTALMQYWRDRWNKSQYNNEPKFKAYSCREWRAESWDSRLEGSKSARKIRNVHTYNWELISCECKYSWGSKGCENVQIRSQDLPIWDGNELDLRLRLR